MHSSNHAASEKAIVTGLALRVLSLFILTGATVLLQAQTDAADSQVPAVRHNSWSERAAMPTALARAEDVAVTRAFADCLEAGLKRRLTDQPVPLHSFVQTIVVAKPGSYQPGNHVCTRSNM